MPRLDRKRTLSIAAVLSLMASGSALLQEPVHAQAPAKTLGFGMDSSSAELQARAGVKPDFGTLWIGSWTLRSGWSGPDGRLDALRAAGVTPFVQFYYWGDDISPTCVADGCDSDLHGGRKNQTGWQTLAEQLVDHLNSRLRGSPAVVVLETEFNKGGIERYEPFDELLAKKAQYIRQQYPAARVVLGFGNWGHSQWGTFDRAAAASNAVGVQGLAGSTRQDLEHYGGLYESVRYGAQEAQRRFAKPVFITDVGLSSYPEPSYLSHQANGLQEFFDGRAELKSAGVEAIIYRSFQDTPTMDVANYFGEAERHWGLHWAGNQTAKPAWSVWMSGVLAERAASASSLPSSLDVEGFATKSAGGLQSDSQASGGKRWNLWSDGYVAQDIQFPNPGVYEVRVRARSHLLDGVPAHMEVHLGSHLVLAADPTTTYREYSTTVHVDAAGPRVLEIRYNNDGMSTTQDRNLLLDNVNVAPAG